VKAVFFSIGIVSIISSLFVGISIFSIKKLRMHPNTMIGYISFFEAISAYNMLVWISSTVEWIEYFGLEKLWSYSTFTLVSDRASCKVLCIVNQKIGVFFFSMMSLGMNLCLCLDLIETLK